MSNMIRLDDLHLIALEKLQNRFSMTPKDLKYPLPERPLRTLGMVRIDGKVFNSEEFLRVLILNITLACVRGVRTIFLGPRIELDLPVFSAEIVLMGSKRIFFLDIQRRGGYGRHDDTELYNRLIAIKNRYTTLFAEPLTQTGKIQQTFSKAVCYMKIRKDQDEQALNLIHEYLDVFLEMVQQAQPLTGDALEQARRDYDAYTSTVIDHDPAAKVYKILFGKKGGVERVMELFFAH